MYRKNLRLFYGLRFLELEATRVPPIQPLGALDYCYFSVVLFAKQ